jgi:hypothetical protein
MGQTVQLIIDIGRDGELSIDANGFKDAGCLKETQSLEEALGAVSSRSKKPEANRKVDIADRTIVGSK